MKICHFTDLDLGEVHPVIGGGVETSIEHQRAALDEVGIDYTTDPWEDHDILHLNTLGPRSLFHLFRAKRKGRKTVIHVHWTEREFRDSFRFSNIAAPLVDRYTSFAYSSADMLVPVSPFTKRFLEGKGIDVPKHVVSNGIDGSTLDGWDGIDGMAEKYGTDGPVAVNLAAVFERKGLSDFLSVGEALPDVDFVWFGPRHSVLTPRKTRRKMEDAPDNVQFPGFVEDKREAFALGDIFFFPSHEEHQPLAILEAMYCGMPMVLRDIPQYDWLDHDENCLKAGDAEEMAAYIGELADDAEMRERLGRNARETAADHSLEAIGEELRAVYEELLADA